MPYYETVFIARQDLSDAQVKDLTDGYSKIITEAGGKIHKIENWGLRNLAYRIKKNRRGHYVLIESDVVAPAIHEVERTMRLNEDILRYMTIREDELSKCPSIVMDKTARDTGDDRQDKKPFSKREAA
ncbi:MAG: 30S ribosomal protein S6 [Alphaproteobacteria bacterium]|nr:30S ribosomal protein S6 [Alphaproteobacteria bacterium]